jgi:uncharacterized protein
MMPYLRNAFPAPQRRPDGFDEGFWEAARQHRLAVQRCLECGHSQFPPEAICKRCQAKNLRWEDISPSGSIYSFVRVWHPTNPVVAECVPYLAGVIDVGLPGVRFVGNILGDPNQNLHIGARVETAFEDDTERRVTLIHWKVVDLA